MRPITGIGKRRNAPAISRSARPPRALTGRIASAALGTPPAEGRAAPGLDDEELEAVARTLLRRWGVVFRRVIDREGSLPPWRDLLRCYRRLEARGEIRGGRFVSGFTGEQYALPDAVTALRAARKRPKTGTLVAVSAADPLNVVGIIPATENMPDGNAIKPGDVVTTMSGQTVEIIDTDSEGRLVLCEALTYAEKYRPAAVVDIATLTGEIVSALGDVASGVFSNSDALAREILAAGESAWDRAWQMPLWDEYQDALKSDVADLQNIGSRADCAVTAACFLSRFTKRYPWVHLDIAGTAAKSGAHKGATGRPVALLAHFLVGRAEKNL